MKPPPKPRRGRPPLVPGRRRGARQLKATVTDEEHARAVAFAAKTGVSVDALIRLRLADVLRGK